MKKDFMYIFFFIFALLALAVWNSGYLELFGIVAKTIDSDTSRDPMQNRQKRSSRRASSKRREIDAEYQFS